MMSSITIRSMRNGMSTWSTVFPTIGILIFPKFVKLREVINNMLQPREKNKNKILAYLLLRYQINLLQSSQTSITRHGIEAMLIKSTLHCWNNTHNLKKTWNTKQRETKVTLTANMIIFCDIFRGGGMKWIEHHGPSLWFYDFPGPWGNGPSVDAFTFLWQII